MERRLQIADSPAEKCPCKPTNSLPPFSVGLPRIPYNLLGYLLPEEEERRIEKKKKEWRQDLYKGTDTGTGRSRLGIIAENFNIFISGKIYSEIAYSCILEEINQGNSKIECSRLRDLLEVMGSLVENGVYGWDNICGLINRLEVEDDRPEKNKKED